MLDIFKETIVRLYELSNYAMNYECGPLLLKFVWSKNFSFKTCLNILL